MTTRLSCATASLLPDLIAQRSRRDDLLDPLDFTNGIAFADPGVMRDEIRVGADIEADPGRPARDRTG